MSVTLRQLETLVAVVQAGSISRASRLIGLSQPTLSQQLAKVEEDLGTPLIVRSRGPTVQLTAAGEFWYRHGRRMLNEMQALQAEHDAREACWGLALRFGTTPSLRGQFLSAAARIATEGGQFSRFDFLWALNSSEVREQMSLRQINCAVVSEESIGADRDFLDVTPLYEDRIVWVVPADLPEAAVVDALGTGCPPEGCPALERYVDVGGSVPWYPRTANWYRTHLPFALPYFGCLTHEASVELAAAGLATCHAPISLFPNLPDRVRRRVRVYAIDGFARKTVLIMPKHLLSIGPFADFRNRLTSFVLERYQPSMDGSEIVPLPAPCAAVPVTEEG
jgi:DNA-binding transcriptional LysR family regulator